MGCSEHRDAERLTGDAEQTPGVTALHSVQAWLPWGDENILEHLNLRYLANPVLPQTAPRTFPLQCPVGFPAYRAQAPAGAFPISADGHSICLVLRPKPQVICISTPLTPHIASLREFSWPHPQSAS